VLAKVPSHRIALDGSGGCSCSLPLELGPNFSTGAAVEVSDPFELADRFFFNAGGMAR
jgi:hypothetical protein